MIGLYRLANARTSALIRLARWERIPLPRRNLHESDERWHMRAANKIHMALVMRACAPPDDGSPEPYRDEDSDMLAHVDGE